MTMTLLFVYGTLKRGFHNHKRLSAARFVESLHTIAGHQLYSYFSGQVYFWLIWSLHSMGSTRLRRLASSLISLFMRETTLLTLA